MKKGYRKTVLLVMLWLFALLGLCACSVRQDNDRKDKEERKEREVEYSDTMLLSLNYGAAGFGTLAECTDAEMYVYTDGNVRVTMYIKGVETELGSFLLDEEDFKTVKKIADRDEIYSLKVKEKLDVCDGNSTHMTLYDKDDEVLITKGGYMPEGKKFWKIYSGIRDILLTYDVTRLVESGRFMVDLSDERIESVLDYFSEKNDMLLQTWVVHTACCFTQNFGDIKTTEGSDLCSIFQAIYTLDGGGCVSDMSIPMDEVMRLLETYTCGKGYTEANIMKILEGYEYAGYNEGTDCIDFYAIISGFYGDSEYEYSLLPNGNVKMMVYWTDSDCGNFSQRFVFTNEDTPRLVEYKWIK